jgi:hypothetical protein
VCKFGIFENVVMPMGIKTEPAFFQRFMVQTFQDFIDQKILQIYLDDFILNTITLEQHEIEAKRLFSRMKEVQIKCSKSKSQMVITEIEFLGNTISENKIYPKRNKAKCIRQKPRPETLKELQAWLGAANYLRKYIGNHAEIVQPLYDIMDLKNVPKTFWYVFGTLS